MFFFSRNPNIYGELNVLSEHMNRKNEVIPYRIFIALADSVEAFPKPYQNPKIENFESIKIVAEPTDILSIFGAFTIYWSLFNSSKNQKEEIDDEEYLINLVKRMELKKEEICPSSWQLLSQLP
jgi:hypothetical protein